MTFGEEAMFYKNENHLSKINFSNELTFFKFFENFSTFFFGYPFVAFRTIWIWFSFLFLFLLFSPLFSSFYQTTIIDSNWKHKIIHPDIRVFFIPLTTDFVPFSRRFYTAWSLLQPNKITGTY